MWFPGFLCIHYPEMMLEKEAKELYLSSLGSNAPLRMKCQVNSVRVRLLALMILSLVFHISYQLVTVTSDLL